jgi:hypothetical protein
MSSDVRQWCVFLPLGSGETWAVSQNVVAEIVTVPATGSEPPEELVWRGTTVSILDPGVATQTPWCDQYGRAGLVAVLLGLEGGDLQYWGVALRGQGLTIKDMHREAVEDARDEAHTDAITAFRLNQQLVQIPDLAMMQHKLQSTQ